LKNDTSFGGFSYRFTFNTTSGEWTTINVPFTSFVPYIMGQRVDAPPVDKSNIKAIGFLISEKQEGPFSLEIDWIGAYGTLQPGMIAL
jgi:hypothetical protein